MSTGFLPTDLVLYVQTENQLSELIYMLYFEYL